MYDKKIMRKYIYETNLIFDSIFVAVFGKLPRGSCTTKDVAHDTCHNSSRQAASRTLED